MVFLGFYCGLCPCCFKTMRQEECFVLVTVVLSVGFDSGQCFFISSEETNVKGKKKEWQDNLSG